MPKKSYPTDLTKEQWAVVKPLLNAPGKRGPKFGGDLRGVVNAMLYVLRTGCQWRYRAATTLTRLTVEDLNISGMTRLRSLARWPDQHPDHPPRVAAA